MEEKITFASKVREFMALLNIGVHVENRNPSVDGVDLARQAQSITHESRPWQGAETALNNWYLTQLRGK
jgi:hypothetical protein